MATYLNLEQAMIDGLVKQFKSDKAEAFRARYFSAKSKLGPEVLEWIRAVDPGLTDHSERHIENVLDNAYMLISSDLDTLSGLELYFLCQVCLFHDVGNFYGRSKHNLNISQVIKKLFSDLFSGVNSRESKLIADAGRAHTGKTGSDPLKGLAELEHIQGLPVRFQAIAAVVRFADELAEGPQRTSAFMQEEGKIASASSIYHKYASITNIGIDSHGERIIINYEFNIVIDQINRNDFRSDLQDLLNFTYGRISKLDQERKYYNHYRGDFKKIKQMEVVFKFHKDDYQLDFQLEPLLINDLVVPGHPDTNSFLNYRNDLSIDDVLNAISDEIFAEAQE
ncbi:hypothetical protein [Cellvibrio sp. NN19]|uniref:HD domain-containing protein n=1 Tax=Cellvibrio chitinivorans TaxID=3102792 RepID=UPI002B4138D2|nr:hypothetical protein [Cellvibrio sp. NN19]